MADLPYESKISQVQIRVLPKPSMDKNLKFLCSLSARDVATGLISIAYPQYLVPPQDFHIPLVLGRPSPFWFDNDTGRVQSVHWQRIGIIVDHIGNNLLILGVHLAVDDERSWARR